MAGTTDLERLLLSLSADFKSYEKAWAKAQGTTASNIKKMERDASAGAMRVQASMDKAGKALAGFGKGLAVGAVLAGVAGLQQLITRSIQTAAAVGDLSDKLGITSTQLQELQYGAVQANMSFEDMEGGLLKFSKALGQAQNGQGELLKLLTSNGYTEAQIKALNYSQALQIVADLTKNAKNEQDGLLVTTAGFGKGQADAFLEFLRNGSAGLNGFATDAHNAGAVLDEELVKRAQEIDDRWAALMQSMSTATQSFVLQTAGFFEGLAISAASSFKDISDAWAFTQKVIAGEQTNGTKVTPNAEGGFDITDERSSNNPLAPAGTTTAPGRTSITNSLGVKPRATVIDNPEETRRRATAVKELADQIARQKAAIDGVNSALEFEHKQLTASDLQREINLKLREAGVTAASKEGEAIAALVTKNYELAKSQEAAIEGGEKYIKAQEEFQSSLMNLAELGVGAFDAIVIGGEKAEDVLKNMVKQLASAAIQATLLGQGPLAGLFGTSGGSAGGGGGLFGALISGFRGGGGPVSAGKSYVVGERQAEVFTPSQSGTISPKVGGGSQVINFSPAIDARGASIEAVQFLSQRLDEISRDFASNVKNVVTNEKARNPRFAS